MTSSEQFCLKWNDFQKSISSFFHGFRDDTDFSDVTLVCEGDVQVQAHKVILSACSPFFLNILKKNKHSHPMIYMRGIKTNDLMAIVDFIYHGEANIYQEDVDEFLALAEDLQLKGLTGSAAAQEEIFDIPQTEKSIPKKAPKAKQPEQQMETKHQIQKFEEDYSSSQDFAPVDAVKIMVPINANNEELKANIDSLMKKSDTGKWRCTMCETAPKDRANMARHVESHIEGISYPCNLCGKISRSAMGLTSHMSKNHRK